MGYNMLMDQTEDNASVRAIVGRSRVWSGFILFVAAVFLLRVFYIQVIRYDYYRKAALSDQLQQYQIPAQRGIIEAHQGDGVVPIVLNQKLYTIYADPVMVKDAPAVAVSLAGILGGNANSYESKLKAQNTRYAVLAKKVSEANKDAVLAHKYPGIGDEEQDYRTYPDAALAAQVLGFVNDSGQGEYGIEQALNKTLSGTPGELKAVTDIHGVPLAADTNNILKPPVDGNNVVLTVDAAMQKQLEDILARDAGNVKAKWASALIMNPGNGHIAAMANVPSYDPSHYAQVSDPSLFNNAAVSSPLEVGSSMKTLTTSAALDLGVIKENTTYYDPARWTVDAYTITNIEQDGGPGVKSIGDILNLSLNTGATWELMQMGGGQINAKARDAWHDYLTNHFMFGKKTGVEQGYEASGYIPNPESGYGLDLTYANTSFGQGMTATALQMGAALSSVLNGGTYYKPTLVDRTIAPNGKTIANSPQIVKKNVVSASISPQLQDLMEFVIRGHGLHFNPAYIVGGKTGTAQIAQPTGGYSSTEFNGTYIGFVGGDKPQYVIVVFVDQPQLQSWQYAGTAAAQPVFADLANMLINDSYVTPKTP